MHTVGPHGGFYLLHPVTVLTQRMEAGRNQGLVFGVASALQRTMAGLGAAWQCIASASNEDIIASAPALGKLQSLRIAACLAQDTYHAELASQTKANKPCARLFRTCKSRPLCSALFGCAFRLFEVQQSEGSGPLLLQANCLDDAGADVIPAPRTISGRKVLKAQNPSTLNPKL